MVSYMHPFFVFLGLLLCLIATRADEQRVIKDSEAIRNAGRYVEVYGLVVSVTWEASEIVHWPLRQRFPISVN